MAENKQVIIDLKVNSSEALQATVALTDKLNDLKTTKKELEKQLKEDKGNQALKEQLATVNAQINSTASSLRGYQKELNNAVKAQESENKSLEQQRATLNTLIAKWDRLSEAERDSAKGTDLINQIQSTTENISKLEESRQELEKEHQKAEQYRIETERIRLEIEKQKEIEKNLEDEKQKKLAQEKKIEDEYWEKMNVRLEKVKMDKEELEKSEGVPTRKFLLVNIMPTLTKGLLEVCKINPVDPIDYLADYLFNHSNSKSK